MSSFSRSSTLAAGQGFDTGRFQLTYLGWGRIFRCVAELVVLSMQEEEHRNQYDDSDDPEHQVAQEKVMLRKKYLETEIAKLDADIGSLYFTVCIKREKIKFIPRSRTAMFLFLVQIFSKDQQGTTSVNVT
jgi:hypothetical protein